MLSYYVRLYERYRDAAGAIVQQVIVLKEGGSRIMTAFERDQTRHAFNVVELWRLDGEMLLKHEAAVPFAVLARWEDKHGLEKARQWLARFPDRRRRIDF